MAAIRFCLMRSLKAMSTSTWVVTSIAVVGSSSTSSSGPQAIAIAAIRRWSWPPLTWWGYLRAMRSGSGRSN